MEHKNCLFFSTKQPDTAFTADISYLDIFWRGNAFSFEVPIFHCEFILQRLICSLNIFKPRIKLSIRFLV